jgi:hypothetical protein
MGSWLAVALTYGAIGCGQTGPRTGANASGGQAAAPSAPDGIKAPLSPPVSLPPPEVAGAQVLNIEVTAGRFPIKQYSVPAGPVQLYVAARGGPYLLRVRPTLAAHQLVANAVTRINFVAGPPGEYIMELIPADGAGEPATPGTAVLTVTRPDR